MAERSELEDAGDIWLSFCVSTVLAALLVFAVLQAAAPTVLAIAASVVAGVLVGWGICSFAPARRLVSGAAQLVRTLLP